MALKQFTALVQSVSDFLSEVNEQTEASNEKYLQEMKTCFADIRKTTAANLALKEKEIGNVQSSVSQDGPNELAQKLRHMQADLKRNLQEINDLDNEYQDLVVQLEASQKVLDEYELKMSEANQALRDMRCQKEKTLLESELEIEMLQGITGLHFTQDGKAVIVGYNAVTGRPDVIKLNYGENSSSDDVDFVEKIWNSIMSLRNAPISDQESSP